MEFLVGTGLALTALGLALFVGVPPPGWLSMPKPLVRFCLGAGLCLFISGLLLMAIGGCVENEIEVCRSVVVGWSQVKPWSWIAVILFANCGGMLGVLLHPETQRRRRLSTWGPWIFIVGGPAIGLVWLYLSKVGPIEAHRQTTHLASHDENEPKQAEPNLDNIIQFNCELAQFPKLMPQNKLYELKLYHPGVVAGGAFLSYTQPPGSFIDEPKDAPSPSQNWLCRVSNFGTPAVINVVAEIAVRFRTNGGVGDDVVHSGRIATPPMNLTGNGGACDIYVRNFSPDHFAEVLLPATATGHMGGSAARQEFRLAPAGFGNLILRPLSLEPSQKPQPADVPRPRRG